MTESEFHLKKKKEFFVNFIGFLLFLEQNEYEKNCKHYKKFTYNECRI